MLPVVHSVAMPVDRRAGRAPGLFPSEDGVFGLLLRGRPPARPEVLDRVSDLYLACDAEWRLTLLNAERADYLRMLGPERDGPRWAARSGT